jgi:hypothetical protein
LEWNLNSSDLKFTRKLHVNPHVAWRTVQKGKICPLVTLIGRNQNWLNREKSGFGKFESSDERSRRIAFRVQLTWSNDRWEVVSRVRRACSGAFYRRSCVHRRREDCWGKHGRSDNDIVSRPTVPHINPPCYIPRSGPHTPAIHSRCPVKISSRIINETVRSRTWRLCGNSSVSVWSHKILSFHFGVSNSDIDIADRQGWTLVRYWSINFVRCGIGTSFRDASGETSDRII